MRVCQVNDEISRWDSLQNLPHTLTAPQPPVLNHNNNYTINNINNNHIHNHNPLDISNHISEDDEDISGKKKILNN